MATSGRWILSVCYPKPLCAGHEYWQSRKLPSEDLKSGEIEPLVEQRRLDAPEIDRPLEVAVLQIAEQRRFAD
jgi:hypothetical protein